MKKRLLTVGHKHDNNFINLVFTKCVFVFAQCDMSINGVNIDFNFDLNYLN